MFLSLRFSLHRHSSNLGFYGVTYHLGFRDDFDVSISAIANQIYDIETRIDPRDAAAVIREIQEVIGHATHMYAHSPPCFCHLSDMSVAVCLTT